MRGTYFLPRTGGSTDQDTKKNRESKGYSLSNKHGRRNGSGTERKKESK
jgi:hypothetical protein